MRRTRARSASEMGELAIGQVWHNEVSIDVIIGSSVRNGTTVFLAWVMPSLLSSDPWRYLIDDVDFYTKTNRRVY